jgi:Fe-S oxidoreductase
MIRELRRLSGAMRCLECGKCSTLCPLSSLRNFSVARMAAIHDASRDLVDYAATVNACLTCGSCETRCPQGVLFTQFVLGLRAELPPAMRTQCPHGGVFQAAARAGRKRDLSWIDDDLRVAERGEIALFVGCAPLFDVLFEHDLGVRTLDVTRAAIRLLNAAGIEPVILDDERCCGHDLLWGGEDETFRALAKANCAAFETRGVKQILTACAECARTWRLDYADAVPGYRPKVQHIAEWLATSPLKFASAAKVTYQDPCRLARHLGVTDAPRELLAATGAELVEMPQHGVDAQCCGTSGFIRCDADSRHLQERRLDDAAATGAERMLTACPKCRIHFACTQREDELRGRKRPRVVIEDITEFAGRALECGGNASAFQSGGVAAALHKQEAP